MIKNIIFDLSEVIISGYHGAEKVIEEEANIPSEEFLERKKETIDVFFDAMRDKYSEDEYITRLMESTDWNIDKEELKVLIRKNLNIPVEGTMDIIKALKGKYNLILLSDHIREWVDYILKNNNELNIFDHTFFSCDIKMLKSDEGTFEYIINDLNIKPEETIFIDDSKENVQAANKSGIKGIIFKDAEQLEKELKEMGINISNIKE